MERTKNFIRSGLWGMLAFVINFLFGLYLRKLFLQVFDPNLLGYQGTIASIFTFFNIAEMGAGTVLTYHLYKALASRDREEVSFVVSLYHHIYRMIGIFLLVFGLATTIFMPYIFVEPNIAWDEVYVVYGIYLVETVLNYFLVFRRALFNADQKAWLCSKIDLCCSCASSLIRLFLIMFYPDYRLYMLVWVLTTAIANILIIPFYHRTYPYLKINKVTWNDYKKIHFLNDVRWYVIQQFAFVVYASMDSILIARFLGVHVAMLVSNYSNISSSVTSMLEKATSGLQAALGSFNYAETSERKIGLFRIMDALSFGMGSVVSCCYMCLFQPILAVWLGNDYLLPDSYVCVFAINQYILYNHIVVTCFRNSVGKYELDTCYVIYSAIINLISSVALMLSWGLTGLMIGTCLAHVTIWYGRTQVLFNEVIDIQEKKRYWYEQVKRLPVLIFDLLAVGALTKQFDNSFMSIVVRALIGFILPTSVFVLFYRNLGIMKFLKDRIAFYNK